QSPRAARHLAPRRPSAGRSSSRMSEFATPPIHRLRRDAHVHTPFPERGLGSRNGSSGPHPTLRAAPTAFQAVAHAIALPLIPTISLDYDTCFVGTSRI